MKSLSSAIKESLLVEWEDRPNNQYIDTRMGLAEMISRISLGYENMSKDMRYDQRYIKSFYKKFYEELSPKEIVKYTKHEDLEKDIIVEVWYTNEQIKLFIYAGGKVFELYQGHINCEDDRNIKYRRFFDDVTNNKKAFKVSKAKFVKLLKQIEIPMSSITTKYYNYPERFIEGIKQVFGVNMKIWDVKS